MAWKCVKIPCFYPIRILSHCNRYLENFLQKNKTVANSTKLIRFFT